MAKKLIDPPACPERELSQVADPLAAKMQAARREPANETPLYLQRGIKGRDGSGEWVVTDKGAIEMPNGDYAVPGDTFNQVDEKIDDKKMAGLLGGNFAKRNDGLVTKIKQPTVTKPGPLAALADKLNG